jgi:hypothetical protein
MGLTGRISESDHTGKMSGGFCTVISVALRKHIYCFTYNLKRRF